jgi:hypothetical protein
MSSVIDGIDVTQFKILVVASIAALCFTTVCAASLKLLNRRLENEMSYIRISCVLLPSALIIAYYFVPILSTGHDVFAIFVFTPWMWLPAAAAAVAAETFPSPRNMAFFVSSGFAIISLLTSMMFRFSTDLRYFFSVYILASILLLSVITRISHFGRTTE